MPTFEPYITVVIAYMVFLSLYIVVGEINLLHAAVIRAFLLLESTPVERLHYSLSRS